MPCTPSAPPIALTLRPTRAVEPGPAIGHARGGRAGRDGGVAARPANDKTLVGLGGGRQPGRGEAGGALEKEGGRRGAFMSVCGGARVRWGGGGGGGGGGSDPPTARPPARRPPAHRRPGRACPVRLSPTQTYTPTYHTHPPNHPLTPPPARSYRDALALQTAGAVRVLPANDAGILGAVLEVAGLAGDGLGEGGLEGGLLFWVIMWWRWGERGGVGGGVMRGLLFLSWACPRTQPTPCRARVNHARS